MAPTLPGLNIAGKDRIGKIAQDQQDFNLELPDDSVVLLKGAWTYNEPI